MIDEEWEGGRKKEEILISLKRKASSSLRDSIYRPPHKLSYFQSSAGRVVVCVVYNKPPPTVLSDSPPSFTAVATKCPPICWVALPSSRQRGMASRRSSGSCMIQTRQAQEFYVRTARSRVCVTVNLFCSHVARLYNLNIQIFCYKNLIDLTTLCVGL